jgi:hypothetical protein
MLVLGIAGLFHGGIPVKRQISLIWITLKTLASLNEEYPLKLGDQPVLIGQALL